jgi:ribosomal protein S18 acetylase RimI-like enzyme
MIRPLETTDIDAFLAHCDRQMRENGRGATLRFALRAPSAEPNVERLRRPLEAGLPAAVGSPGWFRIWIHEEASRIHGHVGLRAPAEAQALHRAFVDIGVLEPYRRAGVARQLVHAAIAWAVDQPELCWLDAEVFAHNEPALRLFRGLGFFEAARLRDMFRLDGAAVDDVRLVLDVARAAIAPGTGG